MFGMSLAEISVILILALVVLGPEKLPDLARTIGKTLREIRRAGNMLRDAVMLEDELEDYKRRKNKLPKKISDPAPSTLSSHESMYEGPLDQAEPHWHDSDTLDDDPYHHRDTFDVPMRPTFDPDPSLVREVELSRPHPPSSDTTRFDPAHHASPFEVPRTDLREIPLHEVTP